MIDQYWIDKARVRASFDRASTSYDAAAVLQAEVRERMFSRLDLVRIVPQAILDAGCGTGHGSATLAARYPASRVVSLDLAMGMLKKTRASQSGIKNKVMQMLGMSRHDLVCGDIEHLPLASGSMGLVWSNLAVQWCNDLDAAFVEMHRVLAPEGLIMFSTFGPDTLKELRQATNADPEHVHVSRFIDMHDIGDALVRAGFTAPVLDVERFVLTYDDVMGVMRDLKAIGAHNAADGRHRGLQGRGFLKQLTANYEQFRSAGKLPATFEVVYGHAWKPMPKPKFDDGLAPVTFRPRSKEAR
ncbi:MAG: malonyl-ACP O-methyltransferase BioC [Candidatus Methylopumilus sp.]|jgi:malonyl-CoA O-methyltransferase